MEPAKIDWKSLESVFMVDQVYENINAPQWVDFLSPDSPSPAPDDVAWFCRPDCKHPKTAEDFLNSSPASKLFRSVSVSKLIGLADWTRREANLLKRRGPAAQSSIVDEEDSENQNPNFSTPPNNHQIKYLNKAAIKSSAEKSRDNEEEEYSEILLHSNEKEKPRLKATQSARDLFGGGKDIFGKITEFCNELKKMASRPKESGDVGGSRLENMNESVKERKPLLEVSKHAAGERSNGKGRPRKNKMRSDEAENIPVSLNLNNVKRKEEERVLPIRTNPPTPQGFSATRDPAKMTTPSKGPKSRLMEREILQDLGQTKTPREELGEKNHAMNASLVAGREERTLDVFWFLKPCTLSG